MATYRHPSRLFATLEVIERLLELREEAGYAAVVLMRSPSDLAECLDAYGFDAYSLTDAGDKTPLGKYRTPLAPSGACARCSRTAH
jgi:hypothetical protein